MQESECKVPVFATHHCGVGGLLIHEDRVLVVKEREGYREWKLPGGYLNLGEDVEQGVAREVREETGVAGRFTRILTMRHRHDVQFGRSDWYIICQMQPESLEIRVDDEIDDAAWLSLEELRRTTRHPMLRQALLLAGRPEAGFVGAPVSSPVQGKSSAMLYSSP